MTFVLEMTEQWCMRTTQEGAIKKRYHFTELSKSEREYLEMVLLEEMDIQAWYCIAYCQLFDEELILTVQ